MENDMIKKFADLLLSSPFGALINTNPDGISPVLYKYRNWNDIHHKNLLIKNQIYMSPPSGLNDPFDCRIYENHIKYLKTAAEKEKYILDAVAKHSDYLKEKGMSVKDARKILAERLDNNYKYQVRSEIANDKFAENHIGVACFSERWDSILMWSHYADNHKGYCIGYDQKWLSLPALFGKIKRVNYSTNYPEMNPLEKDNNDTELKFFSKSEDWRYEEEVRVMNLISDKNPSRVVTMESKYIKEVILGLSTNKNDKVEIISIAKDKNIEVWETQKAEFEFKIERFKI